MPEPRFTTQGTADPYVLFTGEEDDPLDNVPDVVASPRLMVDLAWFSDVQDWDD